MTKTSRIDWRRPGGKSRCIDKIWWNPTKYRMKSFDAVVTLTILYGCPSFAMTSERWHDLRNSAPYDEINSGRKSKDDKGNSETLQGTVENHMECGQMAAMEAERLMNKYEVSDCVCHQRCRTWTCASKVARS